MRRRRRGYQAVRCRNRVNAGECGVRSNCPEEQAELISTERADSCPQRWLGTRGADMIIEYIRYVIDASRKDAFERAYALAGEALQHSKHCLAFELTCC